MKNFFNKQGLRSAVQGVTKAVQGVTENVKGFQGSVLSVAPFDIPEEAQESVYFKKGKYMLRRNEGRDDVELHLGVEVCEKDAELLASQYFMSLEQAQHGIMAYEALLESGYYDS